MKISFIGSGKMAEALISGITESHTLSANSINCTDRDDNKTTYLNKKYKINKYTNNLDAIKNANIIFICIKPQDINILSNELKDQFKNNQTIVSILAGTQIQTLQKLFNHDSIIRIMPNTPAQIKKSVSVWTHTKKTDPIHIKQIKSILASIGNEFYVEKEELIDMATALSASGPAYLFLFVESLIEAGKNIGIPDNLSKDLTTQMIDGSINLLNFSEESPQKLRANVTSPGGTTEAALTVLIKTNFKANIIEAIKAAYERGLQLGKS
jgi:pyrroline-5-carboxylate reductase